jgi:hypothetical protein
MGEITAYSILVGKPEGKRPRGRLRHRWEYNVKIYLRGIEWETMDWMHVIRTGIIGGLLWTWQ